MAALSPSSLVCPATFRMNRRISSVSATLFFASVELVSRTLEVSTREETWA